MDLQEYLSGKRALVDKALDEALPAGDNDEAILHRAMRYSLFAGGKRIRPILALVNELPDPLRRPCLFRTRAICVSSNS